MRIKIIQEPGEVSIDGLDLRHFRMGLHYEIGNTLGAVFLAEGWAEPVDDYRPALVVPLTEFDVDAPAPRNLVRKFYPPYYDAPPAIAADGRRRFSSPRAGRK